MPKPALSVDELRAGVSAGSIDTVILAITDMQGRLQGKRFAAEHFVEDVLAHGTEGCNYLLAVDVEMNTVGGYAMSSWDTGYGDFVMAPDLSTLRRARLDRVRRHGTGVHALRRDLRVGVGEALRRPLPGQPVQRRLLDSRDVTSRADPAGDPERYARRRPECRVGKGRMQLRPARE